MELFNFSRLKRPQLIELAGKVDIKGRHRLRKRDLIQELRKYLPVLKEELNRLRVPLKNAGNQQAGSSRVAEKPAATAPSPTTFVDRGAPLGTSYGQDRLVMLVRDPYWVFCYWELDGTACEKLKARHGKEIFDGARWVLRLHMQNDGQPTDIDVHCDARNWYINVRDNCEMHGEIGIVTRPGKFLGLATSNRVRTPRGGMSEQTEPEFMTVGEGFTGMKRHVAHEVTMQAGARQRLAERFGVRGLSSLFFGASQRASRIPPK